MTHAEYLMIEMSEIQKKKNICKYTQEMDLFETCFGSLILLFDLKIENGKEKEKEINW